MINHGKESGNPKFQPRARYIVASREFVRRGYVVMIPMRSGFSKSSGMAISEGGCNIAGKWPGTGCGYRRRTRACACPYVDRRIVVVGQSHGSLDDGARHDRAGRACSEYIVSLAASGSSL